MGYWLSQCIIQGDNNRVICNRARTGLGTPGCNTIFVVYLLSTSQSDALHLSTCNLLFCSKLLRCQGSSPQPLTSSFYLMVVILRTFVEPSKFSGPMMNYICDNEVTILPDPYSIVLLNVCNHVIQRFPP